MDKYSAVKCRLKQTCRPAGEPPSVSLVDKYDGRVPRYTSYPTAVNFRPGIGPEQYRSWLAALDPDLPLSLYLHIPFCERPCWSCACHTGITHKRRPIVDYIDSLITEIDLVTEIIPHRPVISALHLGGGSPNILSPSDLARLFTHLRERFAFADQATIAAELDPRTLTSEWVSVASELGLTRASLGVQDIDPAVQAAINRIQPVEMVKWAVETLRWADVDSINLDVVYGLPRQTTQGLARTIDQLVTLRPDRLALFGYAHVAWMMPRQKLIKDEDLPDARQRYQQQLVAGNKLQEAGYLQIGLDHFALPSDDLSAAAENGCLRRNFQGYTGDDAMTVIGLGASSISTLEQGFVQNSPDVRKWRENVDKGQLATRRGIALTPEDRFRADIIQTLMCELGVDFASVLRRWKMPASVLTPAFECIQEMERDGLVRWSGSILAVTRLGRPFLRTICASFDQYIVDRSPSAHHARAI
jgi:oxygen-independent coproporphyrinogen III oxidase